MGFEAAVGERFRGVTGSYRAGTTTGDSCLSSLIAATCGTFQNNTKKGLTYKIQVQLKFQILVTSQTFLSKVTICYFQVVYLILLYIFFLFKKLH